MTMQQRASQRRTAVAQQGAARRVALAGPFAARRPCPALPCRAPPPQTLAATAAAATAATTATTTATATTRAPDATAAAAATVAPPAAEPQPQPGPSAETFVWTKAWYPVAVTEFLDPVRPHPFTLLGKDLVLWRDGSGAWRAFEDACPHRLAPLSEGRVEPDGTLLCAYHAWRFDGSGTCTSIPQAASAEAAARAASNPRSCARVHPTREAQGLLWVWGESGLAAAAESAAKPPATISELEELPASRLAPQPWFFRDLPYSADMFIENVTDPAHVNVSHHNVAGNRYAPDQYFDVDALRPVSAHGGFKYSVKSRAPVSNVSSSSTEFLPPSLVKIRVEYDSGAALVLALYTSPTVPGHNRHIGRQVLVKDAQGQLPRGLAFFAAPMPTWLNHTLASVFLHQDQVFLHQQERIVAARDEATHTAKYFLPAPSDNMTVAFRTWLGAMAGGGIPYAGRRSLSPIDRSKDSLFDTYHTHTAQCAVCKPALARLQTARRAVLAAAAAAAAVALVLTAVTAAAKAAALAAAGTAAAAAATSALLSVPPPAALAAALLAAAAGGAVVVLDKLIGMMHRYEFNHADNP